MPTDSESTMWRKSEARLDALQSELEAEARALGNLQAGMTQVDAFLAIRMEHAALMGTLMRRIAEVRTSVEQQRELLTELRDGLDRLRERHAPHPERQVQ
jgi:Mg2+ and Co2+ transporter CorA